MSTLPLPPPTLCFVLAITMMDIELGHILRGGELYLRTRRMIASRSVNMVRHPRGSYIVIIPIAVSGVATPENKVTHWRCHPQCNKNGHTMPNSVLQRFLEGCSSPFMRLADHLTALPSRLVQAMPAWLVKTRRAPSRRSRDARVYGHTTTVMHKLSTPPHPLPSPFLPSRIPTGK